jgi:hypothetical protein
MQATGADHAFSALTGSWTGGGIVKTTNGGSERFRCRSVYEPVAGTKLNLRLNCASDSYNFDLSANVSYEGARTEFSVAAPTPPASVIVTPRPERGVLP